MKYQYEEAAHIAGPGIHRLYMFPNGYGASVVRFKATRPFGYASFTDNDNEWEVAVVRLKDVPEGAKSSFSKAFEITYDTPITDDVIGHVPDSELDELLTRIAELPPPTDCET